MIHTDDQTGRETIRVEHNVRRSPWRPHLWLASTGYITAHCHSYRWSYGKGNARVYDDVGGHFALFSQPLLEAYHKYYYYSIYFLFFLMKKFVHNNFEVLQFLPMVIREGKPWGLNKISGVIPLSVKGISSVGHRWLQIPFWPWRLENLSPMMGFLCEMEKFYFKKWALFKYNSNYSY